MEQSDLGDSGSQPDEQEDLEQGAPERGVQEQGVRSRGRRREPWSRLRGSGLVLPGGFSEYGA